MFQTPYRFPGQSIKRRFSKCHIRSLAGGDHQTLYIVRQNLIISNKGKLAHALSSRGKKLGKELKRRRRKKHQLSKTSQKEREASC